MPWHDAKELREQVGGVAEAEFEHMGWRCHCGGPFQWYAPHPGDPDYRCEWCGQLVDVKAPPEALDYGMMTISQIPWDNYPETTVIAYRADEGMWHGATKTDCKIDGPLPPTHTEGGTWFYKVHLSSFIMLWDLLELP